MSYLGCLEVALGWWEYCSPTPLSFSPSPVPTSTRGPPSTEADLLLLPSAPLQMLVNFTQALVEMCTMYPVSGGFYTLSVR
jgi:hypothetical protein